MFWAALQELDYVVQSCLEQLRFCLCFCIFYKIDSASFEYNGETMCLSIAYIYKEDD